MFAHFPETRWTVVLQLRDVSPTVRQVALAELCGVYWQPLYAFARSLGHAQHDAEDLVQGFLAQLLEREDLGPLSPERGRMRSFFKAAFRHYLTDQTRRQSAQRRGGEAVLLPLDIAGIERELSSSHAPDEAYDRQWASALLARTLARLREKYAARGKARLLAELEPFLTDADPPAYAAVAARLGQSEIALRAAVHRLRGEFRDGLRAEVADTLAPGEDVDVELRQLLMLSA